MPKKVTLKKSWRRGRKREARDSGPKAKELSITSLIDIMTILLVFLIKNVSIELQLIEIPESMTLAKSIHDAQELLENYADQLVIIQLFEGEDKRSIDDDYIVYRGLARKSLGGERFNRNNFGNLYDLLIKEYIEIQKELVVKKLAEVAESTTTAGNVSSGDAESGDKKDKLEQPAILIQSDKDMLAGLLKEFIFQVNSLTTPTNEPTFSVFFFSTEKTEQG